MPPFWSGRCGRWRRTPRSRTTTGDDRPWRRSTVDGRANCSGCTMAGREGCNSNLVINYITRHRLGVGAGLLAGRGRTGQTQSHTRTYIRAHHAEVCSRNNILECIRSRFEGYTKHARTHMQHFSRPPRWRQSRRWLCVRWRDNLIAIVEALRRRARARKVKNVDSKSRNCGCDVL